MFLIYRFSFECLIQLVSLHGHLSPVFCLIYDGTGTRFFTGGDDNLVKVWDSDTGWLIRTIRAHKTVTRNVFYCWLIEGTWGDLGFSD